MLEWEEAIVSEQLGVKGEFIEGSGGLFYKYSVLKDDLCLELAIFPFESDVEISLYVSKEKKYFYKHNILDCRKIRRFKQRDGIKILEFIGNCGSVSAKLRVDPDIVLETLSE